jgi:ankyrin repeat protein
MDSAIQLSNSTIDPANVEQLNTRLFRAAEQGKTKVVKNLIYKGADINAIDSVYGFTPLMWAVDNGHIDTVSALLEIPGIDPNYANIGNHSALTTAIRHNYIEIVDLIVSHLNHQALNQLNPLFQTPLQYAAQEGNSQIIAILAPYLSLEDRNKQDLYGNTALILAADKGHVAAVTELICFLDMEGLNIVNRIEQNALMCAAEKGYTKVVSVLAPILNQEGLRRVNVVSETALMLAAEQGHAEVVSILVDFLDVTDLTKAKRGTGMTALHLAAQKGHFSVVAVLVPHLNHQALNMTDNIWGRTALMFSAKKGHYQMFCALINAGADVTLQDRTGQTAHDLASKNRALLAEEQITEEQIADFSLATLNLTEKPVSPTVIFSSSSTIQTKRLRPTDDRDLSSVKVSKVSATKPPRKRK